MRTIRGQWTKKNRGGGGRNCPFAHSAMFDSAGPRQILPTHAQSSPSSRHVLAPRACWACRRLLGMPVASCSVHVFVFLKDAAHVCPLHKLSPHDNCLPTTVWATSLLLRRTPLPSIGDWAWVRCAASSADFHSTVLWTATLFLFG